MKWEKKVSQRYLTFLNPTFAKKTYAESLCTRQVDQKGISTIVVASRKQLAV